ncbi:hypothetical protein [Virgibacillus sp. DJP39]|uniref:hypothetical protein n=1 Tax=Virgibacillus sp. DJP39 TaxID=3409790 RepID=UPI003BB64289
MKNKIDVQEYIELCEIVTKIAERNGGIAKENGNKIIKENEFNNVFRARNSLSMIKQWERKKFIYNGTILTDPYEHELRNDYIFFIKYFLHEFKKIIVSFYWNTILIKK